LEQKKIASPLRINGVFLVMIVSYVALSFLHSFCEKKEWIGEIEVPFSLTIPQLMAWTGILLGMLIFRTWLFDKSDFTFKFKLGKFLLNLLLTLMFAVGCLPIVWLFNFISQLFVENKIATSMDDFFTLPLLVQLLFMSVMPGVSEELLCRGAFFSSLKKHSVLKAAIISGLFFGILHMNINQFVYATALGIMLALLNECTGVIYSSMLVHSCINAFSVVLSYIVMKSASGKVAISSETQTTSLSDIDAASLVIVFVLFFVLALIGLSIAILTMIAIAAINNRTANLVNIVKNIKGDSARMFNWLFFVIVIGCLAFMIWLE